MTSEDSGYAHGSQSGMQAKAICYKHLNNLTLNGEKQETLSVVRSATSMGGRGAHPTSVLGGRSPFTSMQWGGSLHPLLCSGGEHSPSTSMRWGEHSPSTSKWHGTKKREIKGIQAEKEEVKFPLFADNMICT